MKKVLEKTKKLNYRTTSYSLYINDCFHASSRYLVGLL